MLKKEYQSFEIEAMLLEEVNALIVFFDKQVINSV